MNFVELHSAVYIGHELYNEKRRENEMAKIPKSLETQVVYRNSNSEKKKRLTRIPGHIGGGIKYLREVSIPCRQVKPIMSPEKNRQKVVKRTDLKRKQIGKGRQTKFYVTFKNFPLIWRRHLCQ